MKRHSVFTRHHVYPHELLVGILIFVISIILLTFFMGRYNWITVLPIGLSWIGLVFIIDYLDRKYIRQSFLTNKKRFTKIAFISILFCMILDSFGVFFTRLWYYPYFPLPVYLLLAPLAYIVYTFFLFALYELIKKLVDKKSEGNTLRSVKGYGIIMDTEFALGVVGYLLSIYYLLELIPYFRINIVDIDQPANIPIAWWFPFAFLLSTFFIFEFISFKEGKNTLTLDLLTGKFRPLVAILLVNWIAIIAIELVNSPFQVWVFSNWPLNSIRIFNVPVIALFWWPFQFPAFLAMFRAALSKKEADIW